MTSNYKGVSKRKSANSSEAKRWVCDYKGKRSSHETEREAAKAYDLMCIRDGKEPVNVLKKAK